MILLSMYSVDAFAQIQQGGVNKEGTWHVGEGLEQGDYYHYTICHIDYKECRDFEFELWIGGETKVGTETQLLAQVLVHDGNKVVTGNMTMGKLIPEPTGSDPELNKYRRAFGSSVVWLSAYATVSEPKAFTDISWGKIANIGGEQILPSAVENVQVPAGKWEDTVLVSWKTGGYVSKVWVADGFPFPIKAATLTHVSEGIPPPEYEFTLRDYKKDVQENPFEGIESTAKNELPAWCDDDIERTKVVKKATQNHHYQINVAYGPEDPIEGCEMKWLIKFIKKEDDTQFLDQVQFDFVVLEDDKFVRNVSQEDNRPFLYAPSGQYLLDVIVKEKPGTVNYAIYMYGQAPDWVVPKGPSDVLIVPITVYPGETTTQTTIPAWVKTTAGFWVDGAVDDNTFVQAIQYLITEGIIQIPDTEQGDATKDSNIPAWVKTTAGFWVDGAVDDNTFVQAIQYLITEGIIVI